MTMSVRHISVPIGVPVRQVADYAGDPRNLPAWASGLSGGIREIDGSWVSDSPMGAVTVRFAPANDFGVLDHEVQLPDGTVVVNPLRVLRNGEGSEIVFSVFRQPGVSDEDFEKDAETIRADLTALRTILETGV